MPVTLAQAQQNAGADIDYTVIDEFRKSSLLLDTLTFDDCVAPAGRGATLTYGYRRQVTQPTAAFRAVNSEYAPSEVTTQPFTVQLTPLGGKFQIDRILAGIAAGAEVQFQMQQKIKAATTLFQNAVILGDSAATANSFDGLDKAVTGTSTEVGASAGAGGYLDLTAAGVNSQATAINAIAVIDAWLAQLDGPPDFIFGNTKSIPAFKRIAMLAGQYDRTQDAFGKKVELYNGVPLVDLGAKVASNSDVIATDANGLTSLYAARLGLDGFHAVSWTGPLVRTWLPDFSTAGAVKDGEVELGPVTVALKATKAAGALRKVKVA